MSFWSGRGGRGRGGFHGNRVFRRSGRGGGGGRDFSRGRAFDHGPCETIIPLGYFDYSCQGDLICKVEIEDVPYFSAPIYLENKKCVGKIDEIFGNLRNYYVSIKLNDNMTVKSFEKHVKLFISPEKILPLMKFIPQPSGSAKSGNGRNRGGFKGRGKGQKLNRGSGGLYVAQQCRF